MDDWQDHLAATEARNATIDQMQRESTLQIFNSQQHGFHYWENLFHHALRDNESIEEREALLKRADDKLLTLSAGRADIEVMNWSARWGQILKIDDDSAQRILAEAKENISGPWPPKPKPKSTSIVTLAHHKEASAPLPSVDSDFPLIKSSKQFVADFVPPDYLVDGLLQEGFLYSLTGATGAGKTAITLRLAASVALGIPFANRETKQTRLLYLAAENSADVRMRWIALAQHMDFDANDIDVCFVDKVFKISEMTDRLKAEAESRGGGFGLVIIDTSPVFYEGDDENSRTEQGRHAVMLRGLIDVIPGKPAIVANCHPVKNAPPDNLIPAGGGNFLNSVDGNLTAFKTDSTIELHWQGKFRGVEFAPMQFMLKTVTHQRLKDTKGRLIPTVICDWISDNAKEEIATQRVNDEDRILVLISTDPKATWATLAIKMGWKLYSGEPNRTRAGRCIKNLIAAKLIKETRTGNYRLTDEGQKAVKEEGK